MKKFVAGVLVGFLFAVAIPTYAEVTSLVGKKVTDEYTVVVDGVELEQKAVGVDGRSYTPNRSLAEAVGYDVVFDGSNKKVIFKRKAVQDVDSIGGDEVKTYQYTLDQINSLIELTEHRIIFAEKGIEKAEEMGDNKQADGLREHIQKLRNDLERYKQIKAELEAQQ